MNSGGPRESFSRAVKKQPTLKKRQACEPCRSLKARCLFENPDLGQCTNCIKFKRRCYIEADRRYPRPSEPGGSSGPVLRSGETPSSSSPRAATGGIQKDGSRPSDSESFGELFPFPLSSNFVNNFAEPRLSGAPSPDVIDRRLLDIETATDAFNYFTTKMAHRMPLVSLPSDITVSQCRRTTPVLFLSILLAASGLYRSNLQAALLDEFYKIIADQVVYQGLKRLELVQGILVTWMWMPPPDRLEDMKFSMMAHLAASMVQDLRLKGIRNYPMSDWSDRSKSSIQKSVVSEESTTIDGRRTLLGTFCACAMLSVVLKRSTILPFNEFMAQSLEIIKGSPEAMPNNKLLVAWVELERISMDLAEARNTGSNPAISPGAENLKSWIARTFESRLDSWRQSVGSDAHMHETLMIEYHTVMLYANLLGISDGRPAFEPPFTADTISPKFRITDLPAFGKCISSAQAVLESFLRLSPIDIPTMPGILFPRMLHALLILIVAASTMLRTSRGGSEQQIAIAAKDVADLAVITYFDRVMDTFIKSPGPEKGRATKAVKILTVLKKWYAKNILHESAINIDSSVESNLASEISQANAMNNMSIPHIGILMGMVDGDNISAPAPSDDQSAKTAPENSSIDIQPPNIPNFDIMQSSLGLPLNEEQYSFFESLVESPGGPPWTLFDDAMAMFDLM